MKELVATYIVISILIILITLDLEQSKSLHFPDQDYGGLCAFLLELHQNDRMMMMMTLSL